MKIVSYAYQQLRNTFDPAITGDPYSAKVVGMKKAKKLSYSLKLSRRFGMLR